MSGLITPAVKRFTVVHFQKGDNFSVVPSNWVSSDSTKCYWPGIRTKNATVLQSDPNSSPDATFKIHAVTVVKTYDNYERAVRKSESLKISTRLEMAESSGTDQDCAKTTTQKQIVHVQPPSTSVHDNEEIYQIVDPEIQALKQEFRDFQEISLIKQEEILTEVKNIKDLLRQLLAKCESSSVQIKPRDHIYAQHQRKWSNKKYFAFGAKRPDFDATQLNDVSSRRMKKEVDVLVPSKLKSHVCV